MVKDRKLQLNTGNGADYILSIWEFCIHPSRPSSSSTSFQSFIVSSIISTRLPSCTIVPFSPLATGVFFNVTEGDYRSGTHGECLPLFVSKNVAEDEKQY